MQKAIEESDERSCWNKARDDERVFVLLERDVAAPATIRDWANRRVRLGKNSPDDPQIREALACAALMEATQGGEVLDKEGGDSVDRVVVADGVVTTSPVEL